MTRNTRERARVGGMAALLAVALWVGDGSVTRAEPEGHGGTPGITTPAPVDPEREVEEAAREAERQRAELEREREKLKAELERERQKLKAEMERERRKLQRERQARAARLPIVQIREITPRR